MKGIIEVRDIEDEIYDLFKNPEKYIALQKQHSKKMKRKMDHWEKTGEWLREDDYRLYIEPSKLAKNKIKAIPTIYKGRQYRSRLEARWAAMFSLLGWKAEYEMVDLPGWIPDYSLFGAEEILVEAKPFKTLEEFEPEIEKITKAVKGTKYEETEILLLGCTIFQSEFSNAPLLGWIGEPWSINGRIELIFDCAHFNYYQGKWGFFAENNSYRDRISGLYDGNAYIEVPWFEDVEDLWNQAANEVQWNKPNLDVNKETLKMQERKPDNL